MPRQAEADADRPPVTGVIRLAARDDTSAITQAGAAEANTAASSRAPFLRQRAHERAEDNAAVLHGDGIFARHPS
jgi:hypothetical protein